MISDRSARWFDAPHSRLTLNFYGWVLRARHAVPLRGGKARSMLRHYKGYSGARGASFDTVAAHS
jgi:hypothetical protein